LVYFLVNSDKNTSVPDTLIPEIGYEGILRGGRKFSTQLSHFREVDYNLFSHRSLFAQYFAYHLYFGLTLNTSCAIAKIGRHLDEHGQPKAAPHESGKGLGDQIQLCFIDDEKGIIFSLDAGLFQTQEFGQIDSSTWQVLVHGLDGLDQQILVKILPFSGKCH
jgi:hypothetical protein